MLSHFSGPVPTTVLALAAVLAVAEVLRALIPGANRVGIPGSIVAGTLGFVLGGQVLGVLPFDAGVLEFIVYHGLAIVFMAVALQAPSEGESGSAGATSIAFGVTSMITMQSLLGLGLVLILGVLGIAGHPGIGLLLPMGFEQGPGQAMAFGSAWSELEGGPLTGGSQVGLIIAALGFAWSVFIGVPLVVFGRSRGWFTVHDAAGAGQGITVERPAKGPGAIDALTTQLVVLGLCYAVTWGLLAGLASLLPGLSGELYGLHFILAGAVAMGARQFLVRLPRPTLDDDLLRRINGAAVDVLTCAALAAIQLQALADHWVVVVVVTSVGGFATLGWVLLWSWRVFPEEPFEHAIVWFGMSTGTLPMGLALLRIVDPNLKSQAAGNALVGSAGAILGAAPLLLFLIPAAVRGWPEAYPIHGWMYVGLLAAYLLVVFVLWRVVGPLRVSSVVSDAGSDRSAL